jgi:hypothetical protein
MMNLSIKVKVPFVKVWLNKLNQLSYFHFGNNYRGLLGNAGCRKIRSRNKINVENHRI